jgi:cytoskeleton protein RodZ
VTDPQEDTAASGPGSALRTARESLGYTEQDMADALNLTVRAVADIEAERWNRFPAVAFARGYVRSYAKLLGLDADALLDGYRGFGETASTSTSARPLKTVVQGRGVADVVARQPGTVISGAVVLVVCVVLVVLLLVWPEGADEKADVPRIAATPAPSAGAFVPGPGGGRPVVAPGVPTSAPPVVQDASVATKDVATASATSSTTVAIPPAVAAETAPAEAVANAPSTSAVDAPAGDAATVSAPEPTAQVAARAPESRTRRISPEGDDRVDFEFTEDCWVDVSDAGGRNFSDLARAGDTLVLIGKAPFSIRLGYGPGATVAFNGQAVALAPHTRRNVARLVLDPSAPEQ